MPKTRTIIQDGGPCSDLLVYAHISAPFIAKQALALTTDAFAVELRGAGTSAYRGMVAGAGGWGGYVAQVAAEVGHTFRRTVLVTWSAGSQAAMEAAASADPPDVTVMLDGLYAGEDPAPGPRRVVWSEGLRAVAELAARCARGERTARGVDRKLIIFHSAIPTTYSSSGECAAAVRAFVEEQLGAPMTPATDVPAEVVGKFTSAVALGNLRIVGFAGNDAPEHVRQAHLWDEAARLWVDFLFDANACVPGDEQPSSTADPPPTMPEGVRVLRVTTPFMSGADVKAWQVWMRGQGRDLVADGKFGPITAAATRWVQRAFVVPETGALDAVTLAKVTAAGFVPAKPPPPAKPAAPIPGTVPASPAGPVDFDKLPEIRALYYHPGRFDPATGAPIEPDLLVLHVMQAAEKGNTAENVGLYFQNPRDAQGHPRPASCHYGVDSNSAVRYVAERDTAFHAPGANHNGIGIEHAGYSEQTPADWADAYSTAELQLSAQLAAWIVRRYGWEVRFLDYEALRRGERRGITTHAEVTKAWGKTTHTDPGKSFPMAGYLEMVRAAL